MIGVEGQYLASFSIGDVKDFLVEEQLLCFKIIEDTGNVVPIFQLYISIWDEKILKHINEGKDLNISMGKDSNSMVEAKFKIIKSIPMRDGEHQTKIQIFGVFSEMSYLTDKKVFITDKLSSLEAIQQIIGKHTNFTFKTNMSPPSDKMYWIQPHSTDKDFVTQIWNHTYLPNSFPGIGITIFGEFRYMDVSKIIAEDPKFTFKITTEEDKKPNEIIYEMPYEYSTSSTLNNQLYGFGREKLVANLEAGDFTLLKQEAIKPSLALSNEGMVNKEIQPRYDSHCNQSADNVHANFWKAKIQNMVNLFTFSTVKIILSYFRDFQKIHVLDLVYFKDEELKTDRKGSSETITGLYLVTKVSRVIENKSFRTYVEMCRETPNSIQIQSSSSGGTPDNVMSGV